jgi:heptosyltransferase-1
LIERYFKKPGLAELEGVRFKIAEEEGRKVVQILDKIPSKLKIMVCPGSKWANKQLSPVTLIAFLQKIEQAHGASFLLIWGDEAERGLCAQIASTLKTSHVVDMLPLPTWQNLMNEVDLVIAVDSSALHLCGTTSTPSFSIFGPTSPRVFKPIGERHFSVQGTCPYGRTFEKQCPVLRSCPTGSCIKELSAEALFEAFQNQHAFLQL